MSIFIVLEQSDGYDHQFEIRAFCSHDEAKRHIDSSGTPEWSIREIPIHTPETAAEALAKERAADLALIEERRASTEKIWALAKRTTDEQILKLQSSAVGDTARRCQLALSGNMYARAECGRLLEKENKKIPTESG